MVYSIFRPLKFEKNGKKEVKIKIQPAIFFKHIFVYRFQPTPRVLSHSLASTLLRKFSLGFVVVREFKKIRTNFRAISRKSRFCAKGTDQIWGPQGHLVSLKIAFTVFLAHFFNYEISHTFRDESTPHRREFEGH